MDDTDRKIMALLNENARQSLREISRKIGVSLATVASRIKRLESGGVIKGYVPVLSADKLGYGIIALISIRIAHGQLLRVQEKIARDKRVSGVYDITGDWDSLVIGRFKSREELNEFVKMLLSTEYVERTSTSIALNVIKDEVRMPL